jgi:hypothetical protein
LGIEHAFCQDLSMALSSRPRIFTLPSYSLTGDLVAYLRCGLQYRYTKLGKLPSSRAVQLWFGEFVHGVLEEAYREYAEVLKEGGTDLPPWPDSRVHDIVELISKRLAARGLFPWSKEVDILGRERARVAINELGPELFPLIHRAEVRLTGSRLLPVSKVPESYRVRYADRYEIVGRIDVITHVQLNDRRFRDNKIVQAVLKTLGSRVPPQFEVIIDYKGMRRPPIKPKEKGAVDFWEVYAWQVQTYGHLRRMHTDSLPVVAGILFYVNELLPTWRDVRDLRREIAANVTDPVSAIYSADREVIFSKPRTDDKYPLLSFDYRLNRAMRIIPINDASIAASLEAFDEVVAKIETCRGRESIQGRVLAAWEKNATDEDTCTACDSRTFCPEYKREIEPKIPGIKI